MDLESLLQLPPDGLTVALLVLVRISGLFVLAPIFGNPVVPVRFRVGFAVIVAFLMLPLQRALPHPIITGPGMLAIAIASELTIGLIIGFVSMAFFYGVQLAGYMIGMQMGLGMSAIFDPTTRSQTSMIAVLLMWLATISFLASNSHHWLLLSLWRSFQVVPLGGFVLEGGTVQYVLRATTGIFDVALTLMLPFIGSLLIIDLVLAIMNRVMPQMNVFALGMGIKIALGLASMAAILPLFSDTLDILLDRMVRQLVGFF